MTRAVGAALPGPGWLNRLAVPIAVAMLVAVFVAFAVTVAWHETLDDAAISFAYAKNLAHGNGLVLTRGAQPVEGYSNFLWVLAMVPLYAIGLDLVIASKVLGLAFSAGALVLLARVPARVEGRDVELIDLLGPALAALSLPVALWAVSGMENGLEAFLLVLAVALSLREVEDSRVLPWSGLVFFALALTRPEGVAFWFAAIAHRALLVPFGRRLSRIDLAWLLVCLVPLGTYQGWHYAYFGELVPNTYFAKADDRSLRHLLDYVTDPNDRGVLYLRSFITGYWIAVFAPIALLSLIGRRGLRAYSLPLLLVLTGAAAAVFDGGDWMQYHRFLSPLSPLFYLSVQEGVRAVVRRTRLPQRPPWVVAVGALLALAAFVNLSKAADAHAKPFGAPFDTALAHSRALENIGHQLGLARPTVATPDVGAAAFKTDVRVIDLGGLADKDIARDPAGPLLGNYIFVRRKPDIIWLHSPWTQSTGLADDPRLLAQYVTWEEERDANGAIRSAVYVRTDLLIATASCSDAARWQNANLAAGATVFVRGSVLDVRDGTDGAAVLDMSEGNEFAIVVGRAVLARLPLPPRQVYLGKTVCVRGTVEGVSGVPTIVVTAPEALGVSDEL